MPAMFGQALQGAVSETKNAPQEYRVLAPEDELDLSLSEGVPYEAGQGI
jgi:hypothetical protein